MKGFYICSLPQFPKFSGACFLLLTLESERLILIFPPPSHYVSFALLAHSLCPPLWSLGISSHLSLSWEPFWVFLNFLNSSTSFCCCFQISAPSPTWGQDLQESALIIHKNDSVLEFFPFTTCLVRFPQIKVIKLLYLVSFFLPLQFLFFLFVKAPQVYGT